ncbi:MAG: GxxExxY protein [Bacteroidota bacterium]
MYYDGVSLDTVYRLDLLVERKVIVEIKSVSTLLDVHHKQLITYLKLSSYKAIFRKVNGL